MRYLVNRQLLRHSTDFYLADKGMDTPVIQAYLVHQHIQQTPRYIQLPDPWLAAIAVVYGYIVVTNEKARSSQRLPTACNTIWRATYEFLRFLTGLSTASLVLLTVLIDKSVQLVCLMRWTVVGYRRTVALTRRKPT